MKTSDKKRILSTPTVRGQLRLKCGYDGWVNFDFRCLFDSKDAADEIVPSCVMLYGHCNDTIHIQANNSSIELWDSLNGKSHGSLKLTKKIKYSDIAILWAIYDGISDCRKEFEKAIAA